MNVTEEELKQRYRQLSDEILLELWNKNTLTLSHPHKIAIKNNELPKIQLSRDKKRCHCEGVKRLKQSCSGPTSLEIATSILKNSHFSVFPRNNGLRKFCGDHSDSDRECTAGITK